MTLARAVQIAESYGWRVSAIPGRGVHLRRGDASLVLSPSVTQDAIRVSWKGTYRAKWQSSHARESALVEIVRYRASKVSR